MGYLLKCRYYFQMLATEVLIAQGFYGIIQHFGWKRVGIISQDENLFTQVNETYYIPPTFLYCLPLFVQVLASTCIDLWYWWADTFTSPIIKRPFIFWCISHTLWASNLYTAHRVGIIAGFYELHLPSKCLCGAYHNKRYSNENSELINKSRLYIAKHPCQVSFSSLSPNCDFETLECRCYSEDRVRLGSKYCRISLSYRAGLPYRKDRINVYLPGRTGRRTARRDITNHTNN